jgi:multidrug resistance protein
MAPLRQSHLDPIIETSACSSLGDGTQPELHFHSTTATKSQLALPSKPEPAHAYDTESIVEDLESVHLTTSQGSLYSVLSIHEKRYVVFMAAFAGFFSSMSANMYFPALNTLSRELHVSDELINLTLTSYMVFQGLAPTIYGDLADMTGRRAVYIVGFVIFIAANVGLALQNSYAALFLLRCLQSTGSSGFVALGNGIVSDVSSMAERGTYMGFVVSGTMSGPAIGPIIGGLLSQFLGWRSMFWFLVILSVVYLVPFLIAFPETARHIVGNGSIPPQRWNMSLFDYIKTRKSKQLQENIVCEVVVTDIHASQRKLKWPNPLKAMKIIMEKDVGIILIYNALVYTAYFDVTTSLPSLFSEIYGFNDLQIGISFIPYGVGCVVASLLCGKLIDINYKRVAKANNITVDRKRGDDLSHFPIEVARVQVMYPILALGIVSLICYGWVLEFEAPLAAPLILQFLMGMCLVGSCKCDG